MNKLDPTIQAQPPLPHLPGSQVKRLRRISKIGYSPWGTKHMPIKILSSITPINIFHRPQSPYHTSKSAKLKSSGKMDNLIRGAYHISRRSVTSREKC